ncbi:MAG: Hsp20/alpha crystallin family protein [Bacteriovoracaceae bacterium]
MKDLLELQKTIDYFFNDGQEKNAFSARRFPYLNLFENGNTLVVKTELPGIDKKDIKIDIENNVLTISGARHFERQADSNYHRKERGEGEFKRSLEFPIKVDPEKCKATLTNGVLTVEIEKAAEVSGKQITVL